MRRTWKNTRLIIVASERENFYSPFEGEKNLTRAWRARKMKLFLLWFMVERLCESPSELLSHCCINIQWLLCSIFASLDWHNTTQRIKVTRHMRSIELGSIKDKALWEVWMASNKWPVFVWWWRVEKCNDLVVFTLVQTIVLLWHYCFLNGT